VSFKVDHIPGTYFTRYLQTKFVFYTRYSLVIRCTPLPPPNPKIFHDGEVKKLTLEALVHLGCYTMYVDSRLLMFWNRLLFPDNQRSQLHLWQKFEIWYILTTGQDCNPALRLLNIRELPDCTVSEHLAGHQKWQVGSRSLQMSNQSTMTIKHKTLEHWLVCEIVHSSYRR